MTTDRDTILARCLLEPADDGPRAVLADLLQEADDPADRRLGRWLWAGVTAARFRGHPSPLEVPAYRDALAAIDEADPDWLRGLLEAAGLMLAEGEDEQARVLIGDNSHDRVAVTFRLGHYDWPADRLRLPRQAVFERGMLAGLKLPLAAWLACAAGVLERWPLEWVEVTDVPGMTLHVGPTPGGRWLVRGELRLSPRRVTRRWVAHAEPGVILRSEDVTWPVRFTRTRAELPAEAAVLSGEAWHALRRHAGDRWPGPTPTPPEPPGGPVAGVGLGGLGGL